MAITAYPTGSDTGFSEETAISSGYDTILNDFAGRIQNIVLVPFNANHFDEQHSSSSLDIDIAAGFALMGGHLVESDAIVTKTLDASTTNELFLVVRDSATGNAEIVAQDSATSDPSGQEVMKIWEATTDSNGVTGTDDHRPYIPLRGNVAERTLTGAKRGTSGTIAIDTTGVKTVSVTFTHPYQTACDGATASLSGLDDTAAEFGFIRVDPTTISTTGFTIEAKVTAAASSGTADFRWEAHGR